MVIIFDEEICDVSGFAVCRNLDFVMLNADSHQITLLLTDWSKGDEFALERLMPLVCEELRRMAARYMSRQPSGHTFQTTELIYETYLKIAGQDGQNRAHFFGVAAKAMRYILVDYARSKHSQKRGGWQERVTFTEGDFVSERRSEEIVELDDARSAGHLHQNRGIFATDYTIKKNKI